MAGSHAEGNPVEMNGSDGGDDVGGSSRMFGIEGLSFFYFFLFILFLIPLRNSTPARFTRQTVDERDSGNDCLEKYIGNDNRYII